MNLYKITQIIFSGNWLMLLLILSINLGNYLFKFFTYRSLTEFVSDLDKFEGDITMELLTFLGKVILSHLVHSVTSEYIKNKISDKITNTFQSITEDMAFYKVSFLRDVPKNEVYELWHYLQSFEHLLRNIVLDVPRAIIYLCYYSYTIYQFSWKTFPVILTINLFVFFLINPFLKMQLVFSENKMKYDLLTKKRFMELEKNFHQVKIDGQEGKEIDRILSAHQKYKENKYADRRIEIYKHSATDIINDILMTCIYLLGASYVIQKEIKPIQLMYLAIHTGNFYERFFNLKSIYDNYLTLKPKLKIIDKIQEYSKVEHVQDGNLIEDIKGENLVIFNKITFGYDQDESHKTVFSKLSTTIKRNKINLLLGKNGCGKSTLVKLLLRFHELDSGEIIFSGSNISQCSIKSLRNEINFLFQEPFFFDETIEYNIRYGSDASSETINKVLGKLNIKQWYDENKDKLIENEGDNLSGGEKKKIQLANALLKPSKLYIFDEPTNNLDMATVEWMKKIFNDKNIWKNKTILVITHDIRIIELADCKINLGKLTNFTDKKNV